MARDVRIVRVRAEWTSTHEIEVPNDHPKIESDDLHTLIEIEDIDSATTELSDWKISDDGPPEDD